MNSPTFSLHIKEFCLLFKIWPMSLIKNQKAYSYLTLPKITKFSQTSNYSKITKPSKLHLPRLKAHIYVITHGREKRGTWNKKNFPVLHRKIFGRPNSSGIQKRLFTGAREVYFLMFKKAFRCSSRIQLFYYSQEGHTWNSQRNQKVPIWFKC
jgi:hypothetical protein